MPRYHRLSDGSIVQFTADEEAIADAAASIQDAPNPRAIRREAAAILLGLPPEVQAAFAVPWVAVNNLLDLGSTAAAVLVVQGIAVPAELEQAKSAIIAKLQELQ